MVHKACFFGIASVFIALAFSVKAQSPTETFLRIQSLRSSARTPAYTINRAQLVSRGGYVRSRVTVTASTPQLARRFATRHAYTRALRVVTVPLRQFDAMTATLAEATEQLKTANANVLSQKKTRSGYSVEVEVRQSEANLTREIRENGVSNFRIVALLPETVDGARVESPTVETALVSVLASQKFQVFDTNFVYSQHSWRRLTAQTLSGQNNTAIELGSHCFANVVIVGHVDARFSQDNGGIISYVASANLRVIQVDTGRILAAKYYEEKGFGQDKAQSARQALAALAQTVSQSLPAELVVHAEQYPMTVQMVSEPGQTLGRVAVFLSGLPGVTNVQETSAGTGTMFHLTSREKPAVFGTLIAQSQQYRVMSYGP